MRLKPPKIVRRLMPDLIWEIDDEDGVFLTFDDGPTPGAIVVFHDSEKAFRNMRYALPRTLEKIRQMGFKCKAIEL